MMGRKTHSVAPTFPDIRPPRRTLLRFVDRYGVLLAGSVTIGAVWLVLWQTSASRFAIGWGLIGLCLVGCVALGRRFPTTLPYLSLVARAGPHCELGIIAFVTALFLYVAPAVSLATIQALWPVYIFSFVLFVTRRGPKSPITGTVMLLSISISAVIFYAGARASRLGPETGSTAPTATEEWLTLVAFVLCAFLSLACVYYGVRLMQLHQLRTSAIHRIGLELAAIHDPQASAQRVANIIHRYTDVGTRILLLDYTAPTDTLADTLRVIAAAPQGAEPALYYVVPPRRGVARRAISNRRLEVVRNVAQDPDFDPAGLPARGSEMSVPILAHDGAVVGTLNVQDDVVDAFTSDDEEMVRMLAELLGAVGPRYSEAPDDKPLERDLAEARTPVDVITAFLLAAERRFAPASMCYVRMAVGTAHPLHPPIAHGTFADRDFFETTSGYADGYAADGDLMHWVSRWTPGFIEDLSAWRAASPDSPVRPSGAFGLPWQRLEGIRSLCVIPLTGVRGRVGLLIMFFRAPQVFSPTTQRRVLTFVREMSAHIAHAEFGAAVVDGFARPQLVLHRLLGPSGFGKAGKWKEDVATVIRGLDPRRSEPLQAIRALRADLDSLLDNLHSLEATSRVAQRALGPGLLSDRLDGAIKFLQDRFHLPIRMDVDRRVECESPELKLMLFEMVSEAVRNACLYSRTASDVTVRIERGPRAIVICIDDDGVGFDVDETRRKSVGDTTDDAMDENALRPCGIFGLEQMAMTFLGAPSIDWVDTQPGNGTHIIWRIPTIPAAEVAEPETDV